MSGSRCRTLYPFSGERHGQGLRFAAGELITLLQVPDGGWWEGEKEDGLRGWFPASYVQLLESGAAVLGALAYLLPAPGMPQRPAPLPVRPRRQRAPLGAWATRARRELPPCAGPPEHIWQGPKWHRLGPGPAGPRLHAGA
ncbi:hypothetical protein P7K49_010889 [Saguinus oedipus]|uniref:SH3 domain-containing protein n=1 Tax=Saguinus oedipus TaxID=9490 RepID=A0ABQ9VRD4_SAGOE|nr:hypothetical protein P7K49_010889 [Saguinus oedipus]